MALAALLHDLGKFAERARIARAQEKDADGNTLQALNESLYCPVNREGRRTHIHAAYTAIALDLLEGWLPELTGEDMTPFAPWKERNADDSIINAASKHHRPDTFLQWIVATADRLASGFEREEFEEYNQAADERAAGGRRLNHYTTRQETLFERIRLFSDARETSDWRYPLAPLSPESIFPVPAREVESDDNDKAQARYLDLWEQFVAGVRRIPAAHRTNLPLWLDHFDSLWLTFTHAIPSATAGNTRPDVSLYDHSKTTAALAAALWRYHHDLGHHYETVRGEHRAMWDKERASSIESRTEWETEKFLLIQGDFTGIQNFIFAEGGSTQKRAAKLLRGRSFYVALLADLAALKVLEALDLPATSQVVNAAGKFLIVAPNTAEVSRKLGEVQKELDRWFLENTYGQSGLLLAWLPARAADFRHGDGEESPFRALMKRLFEQLEAAKLQRFGLCGEQPARAVFEGFLDRFEHGECRIDGRSPATVNIGEGEEIWVSALAADQIDTGKWLATLKRVLITREPLDHHTLRMPIFGYRVNFTAGEEDTGRFGNEAKTGNLIRAWDFSLPKASNTALWNGYARRQINAYVPLFGEMNIWESDRYRAIESGEDFDHDPHEIKTLNHLACDDRQPLFDDEERIIKDSAGHDRYRGVVALMTLKGDVDNLGLIFEKGLERPTFAKMAALSRQLNAFFAVYLPWLCQKEFPNTYTVFAGGDDFFLIGPWHSTICLVRRMKDEFRRYVTTNPEIHFSAGLSLTKPGLPIRPLAALAEEALEKAKAHNPERVVPAPKNAITCFGQTVSWDSFDELMKHEARLARLAKEHRLTSGYFYDLLRYTDMAAEVKDRPEAALWHSHFAYRTRRFTETRFQDVQERDERERRRQALQNELGAEIAGHGIERHGAAYKIALFTYLYQQRD